MINFAIVGAGWIGGIHADRLQRCRGARLGVVCDAEPERARGLAERFGCSVAATVEDACRQADAVIISSSTASHAEIALACVAARTPFLVEKPVAHDLAAAVRIRDAARTAGVPATVGFNRRFDAGYSRIRDAVARGAIGTLESIKFAVKTATPPTAAFLKTSGGLFGEFGIHFFDLARWISGQEPLAVFAAGSTLVDEAYRAIGQVDTAAVIVRLSGGALFQLDVGWRAAYGHDERLEAFGSKGLMAAGEPAITLPLDGDAVSASLRAVGAKLPDWFERFEATYLAELEAFVDVLEEGGEPTPTLQDGVVAQMLADAARRSVELDAPVEVDPDRVALAEAGRGRRG